MSSGEFVKKIICSKFRLFLGLFACLLHFQVGQEAKKVDLEKQKWAKDGK